MPKTVKVNSLIMDFDLYPRTQIDSQQVGYLAEAIASGAKLPPIIIDKKTRKIIDGFHRVKANLRISGHNASIEIVEISYRNEMDAFLDAIRLNAKHGVKLDRHDRVHCGIRAKELGLARKKVAEAMNMPVKRFDELLLDRTGHTRGGSSIPLKRTIRNFAGKTLTKGQQEANRKLSGMDQTFYVNQVILLLQENLVDVSNQKFLERLDVLAKEIENFKSRI